MYGQQWACDICTFKQSANATHCAMCENANPFMAGSSQSSGAYFQPPKPKNPWQHQKPIVQKELEHQSKPRANSSMPEWMSHPHIEKTSFKDPNAPKRPPTSWMLFTKHRRPTLKQQYPTKKGSEIAKLLSEEWKNIDIKPMYESKAAILKEKYDTELAEYRQSAKFKQFRKKYFMETHRGFTETNADMISQALDNGTITREMEDGLLSGGYLYVHKVRHQKINCPSMTKLKTKNPLKCSVYHSMKEKYEFNEENLNHLNKYNHFENEYEQIPKCQYRDECKSYIRCEQGHDENQIDDQCHMKLYHHPPRSRQIKLAENVNSLIVNTSKWANQLLYRPNKDDKKRYGWKYVAGDVDDGHLSALITEVIDNKYAYDLCMKCIKGDECKHDPYKSEYSILKIVDEKMKHPRHILMENPLRRDHMLALIMYTGCDCNYDLCASQRNGDFIKWKWLDYCLYYAIEELSRREIASYPVYSGLNGVKLDKKAIKCGYFVTYVSSSWRKEVATEFMNGGGNDEGMIIEINQNYKSSFFVNCCDVSWISKFPQECEVLFSRTTDKQNGGKKRTVMEYQQFECVVVDESKGVQTVLLQPAPIGVPTQDVTNVQSSYGPARGSKAINSAQGARYSAY